MKSHHPLFECLKDVSTIGVNFDKFSYVCKWMREKERSIGGERRIDKRNGEGERQIERDKNK